MGICWREYGKFSVEKLWKISDSEPTQFIDINDLLHMLDVEVWMEGTPMDVLHCIVEDKDDHLIRILTVDINIPLIVTLEPSEFVPKGKYDILDGMHRLVKCHLLKISKVPVKALSKDQILTAEI